MTTTDLGHGRGWLNSDAAASVFRIDAALGRPLDINSAGRTIAEQQALINRWNAGGRYNRPPYLYQPAMPASASPHTKGNALDTDDHNWMIANGPAFGYIHDVPSDYVHFVYHADRDTHASGHSSATSLQTIKDRQNWLNVHRNEHLVVDGIDGAATKAAIERYQTFLRAYGYNDKVDGIWGANTQAAHAVYANSLVPAVPSPGVGGGNPFGLSDVTGLQKVARKYGYTGAIDNVWGAGSAAGFAKFLRVNWGSSMAAWLRAKYQYSGNNVYGPVMKAALARANAANAAAL